MLSPRSHETAYHSAIVGSNPNSTPPSSTAINIPSNNSHLNEPRLNSNIIEYLPPTMQVQSLPYSNYQQIHYPQHFPQGITIPQQQQQFQVQPQNQHQNQHQQQLPYNNNYTTINNIPQSNSNSFSLPSVTTQQQTFYSDPNNNLPTPYDSNNITPTLEEDKNKFLVYQTQPINTINTQYLSSTQDYHGGVYTDFNSFNQYQNFINNTQLQSSQNNQNSQLQPQRFPLTTSISTPTLPLHPQATQDELPFPGVLDPVRTNPYISLHPRSVTYPTEALQPSSFTKSKSKKRFSSTSSSSSNLLGMTPETAARNRCPQCQKQFKRPSSLQTHLYSHTGEKPFRCTFDGCGRMFSVRSNMIRHRKLHDRDAQTSISNSVVQQLSRENEERDAEKRESDFLF
ncbi:hypothetical protein WICMUC_001017 [Wickerhamomyces mucosus]|uniref:C2H2-type domain-containing protein n=1 Tax=Wickerhamomyces mucosus TaxID=1378264 RepID=A0A9P8PVV5_9ASCO|nr:hypothetical protein WICMUC_001017 [Wickerhamomyces mucosus]